MRRQTEDQRVSLSHLINYEREKAARNTIHQSDWMVFRDRMRLIAQEGVVPWHGKGLCYEAPGTNYDVVVKLQRFWPYRSGRSVFPVPAPLDLQDKVRRLYTGYDAEKRAAGIAYSEALATSRYEGAYGMYRRRLASFLWAAAEEILDGTGELE
jgi:hypothetical protein